MDENKLQFGHELFVQKINTVINIIYETEVNFMKLMFIMSSVVLLYKSVQTYLYCYGRLFCVQYLNLKNKRIELIFS